VMRERVRMAKAQEDAAAEGLAAALGGPHAR
jgi:hypothetical protein